MKRIIIALIFVTLSGATYAQEAHSKRAFYLEVGGSGIATSLNYEQAIWSKSNTSITLRGGFGYFPLILNTKISAGTSSAILGVNYRHSFGTHYISIGVSNAFATTVAKGPSSDLNTINFSHIITPSIGYRFQKSQKHKLFAGLGYSPLISYDGISIENQMLQLRNNFYLLIGLNI